MTPAEWKAMSEKLMPGDVQFTPAGGGEDATLGGVEKPEKNPAEELKQKEMGHNLSVNNPATQQWFSMLLPDTVEYREKLMNHMHSPGTALHDPNYKKNAKPLERTAKELDALIAHMKSHHADTPGPGRGSLSAPDGGDDKAKKDFERDYSVGN